MNDSNASSTAVLVCQGRAIADGRSGSGRSIDATAIALLKEEERAQVEVVLSGVVPKAFGERIEFELLRAVADVMAPRTIAIDDAVKARLNPQLVILGAGLDGRAWRMGELAAVDVFEVDHPASQEDKRLRVAQLELRAKSIRFVAVDFSRNSIPDALAAAGHDRAIPTTWIWEGVIPYLSRGEVESALRAIAECSAPNSRLVVNYQTPALTSTLGRMIVSVLTRISGSRNPLAHEPWRSMWKTEAISRLLVRYGFMRIDDQDLLTIAGGLALDVKARRHLQHGRVATADRRSAVRPRSALCQAGDDDERWNRRGEHEQP
jgi:methyltransferase (TIGR00027 family)